MKKYLLTVIMMISAIFCLHAETIEASYRVSFGILGEIGKARAHLERAGDRYTIEVSGEATGLAKSLSRNRTETQVSQGHIKAGLLVPDSYSVVKSFGNKVIKKKYIIDHKRQQVVQFNEKTEAGRLVWKDQKILDYYAANDLLTLYFNISTLIRDKEKSATYTFKAVGAEKQQGSVEAIIPGRDERAVYERDLGGGEYWYLTAIIHQKIFASNRGELMLSIDRNGITQRAILKDVVMFGDILAERIR